MAFTMSGDQAAQRAQYQRAYEQALANIKAKRGRLYQQYGLNDQGQYDIGNPYGMFQQQRRGFSLEGDQLGRSREDLTRQFNEGQQQLTTGRDRMMRDSGLGANLDAEGNPLGLKLTDAPHGAFQNMLGQESNDLLGVMADSRARGLHGQGAGAKGAQRLQFAQQGERDNFRQQLIDQLTDYATQGKQAKGDYSRGLGDLDRAQSDLDYRSKLGDYNLGNEMLDGLTGLTQEETDALRDRDNGFSDAQYQDMLDKILNGDFTPAATPKAKAATKAVTRKSGVKTLTKAEKAGTKATQGKRAVV